MTDINHKKLVMGTLNLILGVGRVETLKELLGISALSLRKRGATKMSLPHFPSLVFLDPEDYDTIGEACEDGTEEAKKYHRWKLEHERKLLSLDTELTEILNDTYPYYVRRLLDRVIKWSTKFQKEGIGLTDKEIDARLFGKAEEKKKSLLEPSK